MVLDECEVEGGIAECRAFGIQDDRPFRPRQNVLRAEIAVNHRKLVRARRIDERREPVGQIAVRAASGGEIRFQPNRIENGVVGESRGHRRIARGGRMDPSQRITDRGCYGDVDVAIAQSLFPIGIDLRRQIRHGERPAFRVFPEDLRDRAGHDRTRGFDPFDFVPIALGRHTPVGRDLQFRQRALYADARFRQFNAINVRRDTAREGHDSRCGVSAYYLHSVQ